jgi:TPR repeat protein
LVTAALTICWGYVRETWSEEEEQGQVIMGSSLKSATFLIESRLADAAMGDPEALYQLGVAYSTGTSGIEVDLIEAHKWFNLAALNGSSRGQECRAEISEEMTAREIAEAQRQARAWLGAMAGQRRAA